MIQEEPITKPPIGMSIMANGVIVYLRGCGDGESVSQREANGEIALFGPPFACLRFWWAGEERKTILNSRVVGHPEVDRTLFLRDGWPV